LKVLFKKNLSTILALISILTFQPTILFAKEDPISNFLTKMFSSKSQITDQPIKTHIFKADITSLNIQNLTDFKTSIKNILKNYLNEKKVNSFLENISDEKDKNLNANNLNQFDNLLPKLNTDKIKVQAIIRIAKKLGKDERSIFEIKKNIILQVVASQGLTLVYKDKPKKTDVKKIDKEDDIDTKKASSSNMPVIAGIAGLGAIGSGGGGGGGVRSSGSGGSSTFLDNGTSFGSYDSSLDDTWRSRQEWKNVNLFRTINHPSYSHPYQLLGVDEAYAYGLSGAGETVAIVDSGFTHGHTEMDGKTINGYGSYNSDQHGQHVAGTAVAGYDTNNANFNSAWSGTYGNLTYGIHGVAYDANLHISSYNNGSSGVGFPTHWASATDSANGAIVQNNSWGFDQQYGGADIDDVKTYMDINGLNGSQTLVIYQSIDSDSDGIYDVGSSSSIKNWTTNNWDTYITSLNNFQNNGVIVFALSNDNSRSDADISAGLPVLFPQLKEAWITVANVLVSSYGNTTTLQSAPCGSTAEYCLVADGNYIISTDDDTTTDYEVLSGSSMAAPQISGLIALLSQAFPNQTPEQLVDRLLASADNSFFTADGSTSFANGITHGYSTTFGHGKPNMYAALRPITSSRSIVLGENIYSKQRVDLNESFIKLSPSFGDALDKALKGKRAYFYDALNGGFAFDISSLLIKNDTLKNSDNYRTSNNNQYDVIQRDFENISFIQKTIDKTFVQDSIMAILPSSKTKTTFIGNKVNLQNALSFSQRINANNELINEQSIFKIPYVNSSENGQVIAVNNKIKNGNYTFGYFTGNTHQNNLKTQGMIAEYSKDFGSNISSLFLGNTLESNGFLDTSFEGAFSTKSLTKTKFFGISSFGWINRDWSFNTILSLGLSNFEKKEFGLLENFNDTLTSSYGFEFGRFVDDKNNKSIHIGFSQPARIEKGDATIKLPGLFNYNGNMNYEYLKVNLEPSGRETNLILGYKDEISNNATFAVKYVLTKDHGHIKNNNIVNNLFVSFEFNF